MPTRRVLVVEDEPAIRGLVALLLEGGRYPVDGAPDGRAALAELTEQPRPSDASVVDLDGRPRRPVGMARAG